MGHPIDADELPTVAAATERGSYRLRPRFMRRIYDTDVGGNVNACALWQSVWELRSYPPRLSCSRAGWRHRYRY